MQPWETHTHPNAPTQPQPTQMIPVSTGDRHHRTRLYAHRVRESLTTRVAKFVCSVFLSLLFAVGLILFILWLSLRPHRPRFHIASFSYPAIANNASVVPDSDVTFDVSDRNPNKNIGIYYDTTMEGSLYYRDQKIGMTPLLLPFYQPSKNTTVVHGVFAASTLAVNDDTRNKLAIDVSTGRVWFRLELVVLIRFRVTTWDSHHHRMHVNCDVVVGPDGVVLPESMQTRCPLYFS